ncbi:MAG: CaiB/BaiF CoA-transferase family protein [Pseudomonadota bacterium]|jgi:alpha-methylacyl-CoA racemase
MKPYAHLRVVEFATVGGVPFCAWWLAQQGAQVLRIQNPNAAPLGVPIVAEADIGHWQRDMLVLDLRNPSDRAAALEAIADADVLLEGFRPGVMERLGLGPADCHARSPGLVYARIVGWERHGPWAQRAGHDINYIAMAGALHACGTDVLPLNLVGDLAAGALYAAAGIGAALHARAQNKLGCVVDTAMTAGSLHLMSAVFARLGAGAWNDAPASNVIDGGVPWYRCYMTSDGRHMAVGAIEERFYLQLLSGLGLDPATVPSRNDASRWPELTGCLQRSFIAHSQAHWAQHFETLDACVTPVLSLAQSRAHPLHQTAWVDGRPAPVPHFFTPQVHTHSTGDKP